MLTPLKSDFMQFTGLEGKLKIDADQSLLGSFVGRTGTAFGFKEVGLNDPQPTLMHILQKTMPKAIQDERKKLIKVMMKARNEYGLGSGKVKGRYLYIKSDRYDHKSIPDHLR